jgi:hypothetical protein
LLDVVRARGSVLDHRASLKRGGFVLEPLDLRADRSDLRVDARESLDRRDPLARDGHLLGDLPLAAEVARFGIHTTIVNPGFFVQLFSRTS